LKKIKFGIILSIQYLLVENFQENSKWVPIEIKGGALSYTKTFYLYRIRLRTFEKFTTIPETVPLIISIKLALNSRIASLQKEQQMKFLKKSCPKLFSAASFPRDDQFGNTYLLSALSSHFLETEYSLFLGHLGSLIFSPDIPTWKKMCENESNPDLSVGYFLDRMSIVSELTVSRKSQVYFTSTHIPYIVDSESFDFLTCNSIEPKIVHTMFVQYFDSYVWLSLFVSIVSLTALIRLKQKSDWGALIFNFIGILLNISTCIGKFISGNKWSFVHWMFFIWFFAAFQINNWYQIVVISDFIKPATVKNPWDHIFSLKGFTIVTPLGENYPDLETLRNLTFFQIIRKGNIIGVHYTHEKSLMWAKYVYNGTILYESAQNRSNAVLAWGYTVFGYSIWSIFGNMNMCAQTWRGLHVANHTDKYGCKEKSEMLAKLDPVPMYDWESIYTKIKKCDNKVAYVSESAEIMNLNQKVNKPGRPKMFQSGNQKQLGRFIFWSFRIASKNDADDIHLKRLKNLVEFGLYRYLKNLAINSTNMKFWRKNEKDSEFIPLNLESNIVSLFYMHFFCLLVICSAAVLSYLVSTLFCAVQLTCIFSVYIFPIRVR